MNTLKAIIVDDEESARNVLSNLLQRHCPNVIVMDKFSNVEDAVEGIKAIQPDVVFLDIEMPNYAGYEIVEFFEQINFEIIFITAYDKYAINAFEVAAIDYLLKPIDIDRLKQAASKLDAAISNKKAQENYNILSETLRQKKVQNIIITDKGYQKVIDVSSIIAIEAHESYSQLITTDGKYMASKNLKHFENLLKEESNFSRIHKSWLINLNYLIGYSKTKLEIELKDGVMAKLSKYRKAEFESLIQ